MSTPGKSPSPQTGSGMTDHGGTDVIGSAKPADARASAPGASPEVATGATGTTHHARPAGRRPAPGGARHPAAAPPASPPQPSSCPAKTQPSRFHQRLPRVL